MSMRHGIRGNFLREIDRILRNVIAGERHARVVSITNSISDSLLISVGCCFENGETSGPCAR